MTGTHRQGDQSPVRNVLAYVRVLLVIVGLIAVLPAVVGILIYLEVTSSKLLPVFALAMFAITTVGYSSRLAAKVMRNRTPSPVILADWLDDAALVIASVAPPLGIIAQHQGWWHGAFEFTMYGIAGLFVIGLPVYWWRGKPRLIRALTARAVAGQWPWSARDAVI